MSKCTYATFRTVNITGRWSQSGEEAIPVIFSSWLWSTGGGGRPQSVRVSGAGRVPGRGARCSERAQNDTPPNNLIRARTPLGRCYVRRVRCFVEKTPLLHQLTSLQPRLPPSLAVCLGRSPPAPGDNSISLCWQYGAILRRALRWPCVLPAHALGAHRQGREPLPFCTHAAALAPQQHETTLMVQVSPHSLLPPSHQLPSSAVEHGSWTARHWPETWTRRRGRQGPGRGGGPHLTVPCDADGRG